MRYFRSWVFDAGLALMLAGMLAALWIARDAIAFVLAIMFRSSSEGSGGAEFGLNLSAFTLAVLLAMIGLGLVMMVAGAIRVQRGA